MTKIFRFNILHRVTLIALYQYLTIKLTETLITIYRDIFILYIYIDFNQF
jgi:hypothetical protein